MKCALHCLLVMCESDVKVFAYTFFFFKASSNCNLCLYSSPFLCMCAGVSTNRSVR